MCQPRQTALPAAPPPRQRAIADNAWLIAAVQSATLPTLDPAMPGMITLASIAGAVSDLVLRVLDGRTLDSRTTQPRAFATRSLAR